MVSVKSSAKFWGMAIASFSILNPFAVLADVFKAITIIDLTVGDRACYVTLENEAGETVTEFATFAICERDLVGKQVLLTYKSGEIVAEICNGNLDCGLSETVTLITAAEIFPSHPPSQAQSPTFLTATEISELTTTLKQGQDSWLGLAGLNKVEHPPELSEELLTLRREWRQKNPAIAPFLGLWHDDEYPHNRYYLSIFPSATIPNYVCVLEYKPEWSLLLWEDITSSIPSIDVISPGIFSISLARVGSAQLISSKLRAHELAIAQTEFGTSENYPVELIPVVDEAENIRVVAAAGLSTMPPDLTEEQRVRSLQFLLTHGCLDESSSAI